MVSKVRIKHLYYLAILVMAIQVIGSFLYFISADSVGAVQAIYVTAKILMFVIPLVLFIVPFQTPVGFARSGWLRSMIYGLAFGLLTFGLILSTFFLFEEYLLQYAPLINDKINDVGISGYFILAALGFSFLHSAFEEYVWRWFTFGVFKMEMSWLKSALISSAAFTLHHFIILSQFFPWHLTLFFGLCVGVGGLVWCFIYQKTNNIVGSWIAHVFADLAIFTVGYLFLIS
ncbi:CPBP family intramembrane metalloprotease [Candidatus Uhrbacteria bacterium]|jgi:uncharacterized protein|nr:CPBP family intramembrane metalloprotease [Candidatus Uhrbacteria bacterium]MBT7716974.1 CPBP family intramembrane metalloprotease [Candidatus Uhrbacteria bacterium]